MTAKPPKVQTIIEKVCPQCTVGDLDRPFRFFLEEIQMSRVGQFRFIVKYLGVAVLVIFLMPLAGSVTRAQSPTPTSQPKATAAPGGPKTIYQVFLPVVQVNVTSPAPVKKGVPLTYNDCPSVLAMNASWEYAWSPNPPNCAGVENIPMISGSHEINYTLGGNSQWIMGFNEPDSASQANMTPSQAASAWRQIEEKYPTRKLLAPGPSGANPSWMVDFRNTYIATYGTAPRLDGLDVHCYAWYAWQCTNHTQQFLTWANSWGVPEVWVTEFSFSPTAPSSPTQSLREAQTFITWMENDSKITRFAWFASKIQGTEWWLPTTFNTPLIHWTTGQPTSFGNMYLPFH